LTPTQRLVLLALAEYADDEGATSLPSLRRLERMTSLSRRGIAKTLNALEAAGLIARDEGECAGATAYRLFLDRPASRLDSHENDLEGGSKHVS